MLLVTAWRPKYRDRTGGVLLASLFTSSPAVKSWKLRARRIGSAFPLAGRMRLFRPTPRRPRDGRGGSRARRIHVTGGNSHAPQACGRISTHPGRPVGVSLVVLPPAAHPPGRSPRLVRRL